MSLHKKSSTQVFLVGAGPGDPQLFTLKMVQVLSQADVVLYDYLVHPNFRQYCHKNTTLVNVGKKKGHYSAQQSHINQLLKEYVAKEQLVVRLKGGDPLIFGRGGEEMEFLQKNNITYEIVPGLSSTLTVPAYSGISLTHRDYSRSIAVVTGTIQTGELIAEKEYPQADTLIFLMAMTHLTELAKRLQSHSRFSAFTPAMVIQEGTLATQREVCGTLETIATLVNEAQISHPALLVVGDVVGESTVLAWRDQLPLNKKRIWVCRAKHQQQALSNQLSLLGAEVIQAPLIKVEPLKTAWLKIDNATLNKATMILLTSYNAVKQFLAAVLESGLDIRNLAGKQIGVVGQKTAQALNSYGIIADIVASSENADGLLAALPQAMTGHHVLLPQGRQAAGTIYDGLVQKGATVTSVTLYDTVQIPASKENKLQDYDIVILMSGTQMTSFFKHVYHNEKIHCIVPSQALEEQIRAAVNYKGTIQCAKSTHEDDLIEAIMQLK